MRAPMECWRPEANRHAHARLKGPVFQAPDPPSSIQRTA